MDNKSGGYYDREASKSIMTAARFWREQTAFEAYNRSRNLSSSTIKSYGQELRQFHRWFIERHGSAAKVTARRIREYMAARFARGNKPGSVRASITALRSFYRFLMKDKAIVADQNPMPLVESPRMSTPEIRPLSTEEIRRLLDSFDKDRLLGYRNFVICLLILDTGLRIGEVTRLGLGDVSLDKGSIKVKGKGNKKRTVFVGEKMSAILEDYIYNCRRWFANEHDTLFPPAKWSPNAEMRPHTLSEIIRKKMDQAGIPRCNSSGHRLRHTFAANFVRAGGNLFALKRLLGHTRLEMTMRYVLLIQEDLAEAHRKASPVDRMSL